MLKFEDYKYEELNCDEICSEIKEIIKSFKNAKSAEEQIKAVYDLNKLNIRIDTAFSLCSIRYSLNVNDEYYSKQQEICDEMGPRIQEASADWNKAIVDSKFKDELNKEFGTRFVSNAEIAIRTFKPEIVEDLIKDNKLCSKYSQLLTSIQVEYNGEKYGLTQMGKFTTNKDRQIRKESSILISKAIDEHLEEFDNIYDEMVKTRDNIAKKLGFDNYMEYRYLRMNRTDYTPSDVEGYRDAIYKYVVPVTNELFARQAKRLGIENMQSYDYNLEFLTGNATPKGSYEELIDAASLMYKEMSPETDEFFSFMRERNLLDLVARKGKQAGGYTTVIASEKAPYIFSNFNGTSGDVDVLTHEAGHAFMAYRCKDVNIIDNWWPTMEACEIHSMSMEFFAYPWMKHFFKEETEKYKFSHMNSAITFLPYGVAVDEFQTYVYTHVNVTPEQRRMKWLEIQHKYLPHIKYDDDPYIAKGTRWFRQSHIFTSPFYYIDYTLAQVCAFEFFNLMNEDRKDAWNRYVNLCNLGGSKTFLNLLKDESVRLVSPFEKGCIENTIKPIKQFLDSFDDSKM